MNRLQQALAAFFALCLTFCASLPAQDTQGGEQQNQNRAQGGGGQGGFRNMDWQNMDPQQMQDMIRQRMMQSYRDQLEITDDAEWQIIEARLTKVMDAQRDAGAGGAGGLGGLASAFGRGGRGGGGGGQAGGGRGLQALFGQPSPEAEALQQAIDAKAPAAELKVKLAKLQETRKQKQAELVKARDELRKVLSVRRESIAVLMGLLD